ncbi:hypothetical protein BDA99DRAFT_517802 [Phascolomyces articulosus]|uniref:HTH APSES-type domain-containing protein n=1 Tax=Phascolomyces articulosus TaxID=60185 RepID=A0AAD5JUD7_9FUNG|nr:hypothetical protein BDA99DRAFT_517802 [Phascolomyces articulosus]
MESTNPFLSPTVPQITSAKTGNGDNKDVTAPPPPSPLDILKTLSIPNLNIAALQQMTAAIPGLAHLSSTIDLAKTLAAYMQTVNNHNNNNNKSPSSSSSPSPALPPNFASDFKQALARFPALETLFRKESFSSSSSSSSSLTTNAPATTSHLSVSTPTTPTTPHPPHSPQHPAFVHITDPQQQIVHTTMPTNPPMYITIVDNIPVCVAVLAPPTTENNNTTTTSTDQQQACRIMRRLDSGYINGTKLLTAGGIDTESERSMILSFEMERRRMPRKKSELYGTWIPLRRAQELAVTCSIQHRLGPFLSDSIESYFPSPLPIQVPMLSQHPGHHGHRRTTSTPPVPYATSSSSSAGNKDSRLAALTLQALRHPIGISDMTTTNGTTSSTTATSINSGASDGTTTHHTKGYGPSSPPTQTTSAAQLHQLLLGNNPRKFAELAQKAPLLGTFEGEGDTSDDEFGFDDEVENKQPPIIDSSNAKPVIITAGGRKTILGGPLNNKRKRKQLRKPKKKKKKQEEDESSDVDIVNSGSSSSSSSSSSEEEEEEEQVQQVQIIEEQIRQPMEGDEEEEDADTDTDTDVEEVRQRMKRMRDAAIDAMESGSSIDLEELLRRASSPIVENPRRGPLLTTTHTAATALPGNRIPLVNTIGNNGSSATGPSFNSMRRQGKATARRRPQGPGRSMGGKIAPSALKKSASWSGTLTSPLRVVVPTKKLQNKKHSSTATRPSKLRQNTAADELLVNRVVEHTSPSASSSSSQPSTSSSVTIIKVPTTVTHHHQNNNATTLVTSSSSDNVTTTVGGTNTTTASTMPTPSVVSAPTTTNTTTKHDLKPTPSSSTDVLATIQEDDEDEEIDIGGSEEDDDLR